MKSLGWARAALAALVLALAPTGCAKSGMVRIIPAPVRPTPIPASEQAAAASQSQAGSVSATAEIKSVTLRSGDSFWRIAARELGQGSRYAELAAFNQLDPSALILPGQTLRLPEALRRGGPPARPARKAVRDPWPKRKNQAYTVGEKLTFAVQYFNMTAGYAVLSIPEYSVQQGRSCLHILAEAKTHPFFETFFKVRDKIETFIDAEALIPWRYEKHLREGGYSADAFYIFDQRAQMMHEPSKGKDVTVSAETQDVLSCFFWFRTMDLTPGRDAVIKVAADDMKSYDLLVNVLRKEKVKTLAGTFDCILVQPHLKFEGLFQQKGEVFIWITDDARRIPVKIQSKIAIGSININLQEAEWVQPPN